MDLSALGFEPLGCQREAFSLPQGLHYLNCAYMSPLPLAVEKEGFRGIVRKRDPSLLAPEDFFQESEEVRRLFARLVNAPDPASVAILPSVSYGIGVAAQNTPLTSGQNIVLLHEQFPGNVYGWRRLAWERGAKIKVVGPGDEGPRGRSWNERILEAIDRNTGVVALAPVHWTDGTVFDLESDRGPGPGGGRGPGGGWHPVRGRPSFRRSGIEARRSHRGWVQMASRALLHWRGVLRSPVPGWSSPGGDLDRP